MTPVNRNEDHHFSSFAMGVSVGVVAALLFGTEEGRKIVKNALDAIPDKYKQIPEKHLPPTPII
ncbi:YtxH domain-containing protein, partial [bacterium]